MQSARFSFGPLFAQSQISAIAQPVTQKRNQLNQQQQSYRQKYLQCKENIKKFMQMVQKEFQLINQKHNTEKQALQKQIAQLKSQLHSHNNPNANESNEVSNFTVRSNKFSKTNQNVSSANRSSSQQASQSMVISFDGIQTLDHSKIHSRAKSIVDKNFSTISNPNTLVQLKNAINQSRTSRLSSKTTSRPLSSLAQNDAKNNSLNVTQYTNLILSKRKNSLKIQNQKQNFDVLMQKIMEKNISNQIDKEKKNNQAQQTLKIQIYESKKNFNDNKENITSNPSTKSLAKQKSQQASVRNILKNLRNTMKTNIEKQSNLEATKTQPVPK